MVSRGADTMRRLARALAVGALGVGALGIAAAWALTRYAGE